MNTGQGALRLAATDLHAVGVRDWGVWRVGQGWLFAAAGARLATGQAVGADWAPDALLLIHPTGVKAIAGEDLASVLVEVVNELCDLASEYRNEPVPWVRTPSAREGAARLLRDGGGAVHWCVGSEIVADLGTLGAGPAVGGRAAPPDRQ